MTVCHCWRFHCCCHCMKCHYSTCATCFLATFISFFEHYFSWLFAMADICRFRFCCCLCAAPAPSSLLSNIFRLLSCHNMFFFCFFFIRTDCHITLSAPPFCFTTLTSAILVSLLIVFLFCCFVKFTWSPIWYTLANASLLLATLAVAAVVAVPCLLRKMNYDIFFHFWWHLKCRMTSYIAFDIVWFDTVCNILLLL